MVPGGSSKAQGLCSKTEHKQDVGYEFALLSWRVQRSGPEEAIKQVMKASKVNVLSNVQSYEASDFKLQ